MEKLTIEFINLKKENFNQYFEIQQLREQIATLKEEIVRLKNKEVDSVENKNSDTSNSSVFEVEQLLKHRGRKTNREFLVRWKGYNESFDTWEKQSNLFCKEILEKYMHKHNLR